jgi:hypothetical protein
VLGDPFWTRFGFRSEDGFFIGAGRVGRRRPRFTGVVAFPHLQRKRFRPACLGAGAAVRYLPARVDECKALVLPGTKNTADLSICESGMAEAVRGFRRGGAVAGICGGYQIMGGAFSIRGAWSRTWRGAARASWDRVTRAEGHGRVGHDAPGGSR